MIRLIVAAFFLTWAFAAPLSAQSAKTNSSDEIRPLLEKMETAANTHDTDAFMIPFAHDTALIFCFNGQVIHGFDALHEQQLKWWNNGKTDVAYTRAAAPEFVQIAPDVVMATLVETSTRTAPDGTKRKGTAALSLMWKKTSAGWQIVYGHESLLLN